MLRKRCSRWPWARWPRPAPAIAAGGRRRQGGRGGQAVRGIDDHRRRRGGAAGAARQAVHRPGMGEADRHQGQRGRAALRGDLSQDASSSSRPAPAATTSLLISPAWLADMVANGAVDAARSLYREVWRQVRVRRHQSRLQGLDVLRRQDLRPRRRWRRAGHLLPQGSVRGSREPERLQGQIRLRSRPAEELQGVRRYRLLPDREVPAGHVWRWASSTRATCSSSSASASATMAASSSIPRR